MKSNLREEAVRVQEKFKEAISANNNESNDAKHEKISQVIDFMKDAVEPFLSQNTRYDKTVFLMGPTGAGKSTLINYLAGEDLYYRTFNDMPGIFPNENDSIAFVGKGEGSTTLVPNIWMANTPEFPSTTFIDCAGDFDSSGIIVEIINERIKAEIARNVTKAKVLIVTSQNSISPAGSYGVLFKEGLEKSAQFLHDIRKFDHSMAFIVSHAGRGAKTPDTVKAYLEGILARTELIKYHYHLRNILNKDLVKTFSTYSEESDEGDMYTPPKWNLEQRENLIELINKIEFSNVPPNFFNISTSAEIREQMGRAFKIVESKAVDSLVSKVQEIANTKLIIHALKLKGFVNFIEQELVNQPCALTLKQYVDFINSKNYFRIAEPDNMEQLSNEIDFLWPYTRTAQQQHDQPFINWNSYMNFGNLLKDHLNEAKYIIHDSNALFSAFFDYQKITSRGYFDFSNEIKQQFGSLNDSLDELYKVEQNKYAEKYHYNKTESKFMRMEKQQSGTKTENYTENNPEILEVLPIRACKDKKWKFVKYDLYGQDLYIYKHDVFAVEHYQGFYHAKDEGAKRIYHRYIDGKLETFEGISTYLLHPERRGPDHDYLATNGHPYGHQYLLDKGWKLSSEIRHNFIKFTRDNYETKQRLVVKYENVPIFEDITVKKHDEQKYNNDVRSARDKIEQIKSSISTLLVKTKATNVEAKSKLPLDKAAELEQKAKILCNSDTQGGCSSSGSSGNDLNESWKMLEYEAMVLQDYADEIAIAGDS